MIDRKPPELFAERPITSDYGRRRGSLLSDAAKRKLWSVLLLALVIGAGTYFLLPGSSDDQPAEIPTIRADTPVKERPEQPGGVAIPHQEETVFQQIDSDEPGKTSAVEHLLPPPETPLAPPATPAVAADATQAVEPQPIVPLPESATPVEPVPAPAPVAVKPAPQQVAKPAAPPTAEPPVAQAPAVPKPTKPEVVGHLPTELFTGNTASAVTTTSKPGNASKGWLVQLASAKDQQAAQAQVKTLQSKYAGALGDAQLRLTRADLGAKGIFYRVQSESLTEERARDICSALQKQKAACIVVHP